jgi:hypothetical protein
MDGASDPCCTQPRSSSEKLTMRSSQALSFLGALCLIFGLGMTTYQVMMSEAGTNSTWNVPHEGLADRESLAFKRSRPGLIVLGVGAGLLLAGAWFERRSG